MVDHHIFLARDGIALLRGHDNAYLPLRRAWTESNTRTGASKSGPSTIADPPGTSLSLPSCTVTPVLQDAEGRGGQAGTLTFAHSVPTSNSAIRLLAGGCGRTGKKAPHSRRGRGQAGGLPRDDLRPHRAERAARGARRKPLANRPRAARSVPRRGVRTLLVPGDPRND